ncbi:DUF4184 family protein [Pontibacter qinzhouensis]|uniref:DUF4184 family protein n=1 Tax=Pontibacter qinzhouensis TaxID=2603253 RepID=A0A5C8K905_9BACT|nr:DUF4184 family protein [Pontibacter qinzhouensis]TXK46808.1 DUF4184 family protein [Pontibacter qinzhouensis]
MPFTFSHPAIVLPFCRFGRGWFSLTGLVIGSMAPDFEKFLKMGQGNTYSHTLLGILWFNLPISILIALLFHEVVRNPLIESLPNILRSRLSRYKRFDWVVHFNRHYKSVVVSIILGALTHLLWDAFTHKHSFVADMVPLLKQKHVYWGFRMPVYLVLQLISSLVGLLYILFFMYRLPVSELPERRSFSPWLYWLLVLCVMALAMAVRFWVEMTHVMDFIFTTIAAFLLGIVIASFWQAGKRIHLFRKA